MQEKVYKASLPNQLWKVLVRSFVFSVAGAVLVVVLYAATSFITPGLNYLFWQINDHFNIAIMLIILYSLIHTFVLKKTTVTIANNYITILQGSDKYSYSIGSTPIIFEKQPGLTLYLFPISHKYVMKAKSLGKGVEEIELHGFSEKTFNEIAAEVYKPAI